MHCASCVRLLEKALSKIPGVEKATVNLATEKASVNYDSQKVSDTLLENAVASVGYKALINKKDDSTNSEAEQKTQKQKELQDLKIKVRISLVLGSLILWGRFPGLINTAFLFNCF